MTGPDQITLAPHRAIVYGGDIDMEDGHGLEAD